MKYEVDFLDIDQHNPVALIGIKGLPGNGARRSAPITHEVLQPIWFEPANNTNGYPIIISGFATTSATRWSFIGKQASLTD